MISKIPNFEDSPMIDDNGMLTPIWKNIMQGLVTFLQQNHSQEGLVSPRQSTATITSLGTTKSVGSMIYDTDFNQYKVCEQTGVSTAEFKTVVTSKKV